MSLSNLSEREKEKQGQERSRENRRELVQSAEENNLEPKGEGWG